MSPFQPKAFLRAIAPAVEITGVSWKSASLTGNRVGTVSEAVALLKRVKTDRRLISELQKLVDDSGGVQSEKLWNLYFRTYDRIVAFADGYVGLLARAHEVIPTSGRFLDLGAGTGNFSTALLTSSPARSALAIDLADTGLALAREKLKRITQGEASRFQSRAQDMRMGLHFGGTRFDGAVMNNVLYSIPEKSRLRVLQQIFRALAPGAPFFLNDPLPEIYGERNEGNNFLTQIAIDAVLNSTPATDFDFTLFTYINSHVLMTKSPRFLSAREISDLVLAAGFQIYERVALYYDTSTALSLRRPVLANHQSRTTRGAQASPEPRAS